MALDVGYKTHPISFNALNGFLESQFGQGFSPHLQILDDHQPRGFEAGGSSGATPELLIPTLRVLK